MNEEHTPSPTGASKQIQVTGMLMPYRDEQPAFVHMTGVGESVFYLPLFSSEDALREVCSSAGVTFDRIKQVTDGPEFLSSIPLDIIIVVDIHFTPEGRVRFHQLQRTQTEN